MIITDQPGRLLAIFVFAPLLFFKGYKYKDYFILSFSILLFLWDFYWIINHNPKQIKI